MTLDQFVAKYNGKGIDFDGHYGNQCVDLWRQYVKEVLGFPQSVSVKGAVNIWDTYLADKFERIPNTPQGIPTKGDIMIWNKNVGGGYGHVGIFIEGDVNAFKSFDQNWPKSSLPKIVNHKYTSVLGWLKPKSDNALAECLKSHADLMSQLIKQGEKLAGVEKKLITAGSNLKSLREIEASLTEEIGELEKEGGLYQSNIDSANRKIEKLTEENETLSGEKANYKKWYEAALKNDITKKNSVQLFVAWIKSLKFNGNK